MDLLLHLERIVSDFWHLFNQQNFALFQAFIVGFMTQTHSGPLDRPVSIKRFGDAVWDVSEVSFPGETERRCSRLG